MAEQNKEFLQKLLATFRSEAAEHLQDIASSIVALEQAGSGNEPNLVERILKRLHTLKGAARAVNLGEMESLCHALEGLFSAIRTARQPLIAEDFDLMHQGAALADSLLQGATGRTRNQTAALAGRLAQRSEQIRQRKPIDGPGEKSAHKLSSGEAEAEPVTATLTAGYEAAQPEFVRVQSDCLDTIRYQVEALLEHELALQHHADSLLELADEIASQREQMRGSQSGQLPRSKGVPAAGLHSGTVQAEQFCSRLEHRCRQLASTLGRSRRSFSQSREKLMSAALETALVPFSSALAQLPPLVRNLARQQGKEVTLRIAGEGILVDRRVLDSIADALIHLVTNAVDHGIEPPDKRREAGKPLPATVSISVVQNNGSEVEVTVADDGAGINVPAVVEAAVRSASLSPEQVVGMDGEQALRLALHAGVSTRRRVTQVSGRGVGLAVVAEKVHAVGGKLHIENHPGSGCAFRLQLPVRLASLRALVVKIRNQCYVLPLAGVEHVCSLQEGDLQNVENRETVLVRGQVVPAVRLGLMLGLAPVAHIGTEAEAHVIVIRSGEQLFALLVDEIAAEQEVLPKGLGPQLRRVRFISGACRLGDGTLVPVLSLDDISHHGLLARARPAGPVQTQRSGATVRRLLVVEDSVTSRLLLKHILEGGGYQVETAVDGLDAVSKLRQQQFHAVVSDIEMPGMDGLALTAHIRSQQQTANLPVVLVTSLQSPEEKERGLKAGADAYVTKGSFDQDNLLDTLRRLL